MEVQELRGKADAWTVEKQRLEATNAELQRSTALWAQQKGALARLGERGRGALAARWAGRGPGWGALAARRAGRGAGAVQVCLATSRLHVLSLGLGVLVTGDHFFNGLVSWSGGHPM